MRARYAKWDGSQDPFGPDLDIGDILEEISDDILSGRGPNWALQRLMRHGMRGRARGLDELLAEIRRKRAEAAERLNLDGPLGQIQDQLDEIIGMERAALAERDDEDARARETFLDLMPSDPAGRLNQLSDYRFVDALAQQKFDELVEKIRSEILNSYFGSLAGAIQNMTAEDVAHMREMLQALNQMIEARERGEPYDFEGFMQKYGDFFPENPRNLDELLEVLARRMAAMSRLLASLSPEQRRQLEELARSVMEDLDIAFQMDQLSGELRQLMPHLPWDQPAPGWGDDPSSLSEAVGAIDEMGELEQLEDALRGDYAGAEINDVDEEKLQRALGKEAVRDLRRLKQIEKALEEAGIVTRNRGQLELTARGARRIGERALVRVFEDIKREREGAHDSRDSGGVSEPTGATRPWKFGDTGEISVQRTVFNAVVRTGARQKGGLKLVPDDFELIEAETRTRTATALLLDLSFSMPLRGHWVPAKKMALALQALIEGKYPQDKLYLIGFSDYARRLEPRDLTAAGPIERVYGTNMQHAFLLARRLLSEHPRASKQVIMVTDGEPTAHLEEHGPPFFSWPPVPETITKTLAEAIRLAQHEITLNIFMLEDSPGLVRFMEELAKRTGGRVFHAASEDLGHFILRDYVRRRHW